MKSAPGCNPARYVAGTGGGRPLRAGASIFEQTRVQEYSSGSTRKVERDGNISTSRGPIWAREVFVGTSGYTGKATPALQKKIIPIGSFIITTEVLPEALAQ